MSQPAPRSPEPRSLEVSPDQGSSLLGPPPFREPPGTFLSHAAQHTALSLSAISEWNAACPLALRWPLHHLAGPSSRSPPYKPQRNPQAESPWSPTEQAAGRGPAADEASAPLSGRQPMPGCLPAGSPSPGLRLLLSVESVLGDFSSTAPGGTAGGAESGTPRVLSRPTLRTPRFPAWQQRGGLSGPGQAERCHRQQGWRVQPCGHSGIWDPSTRRLCPTSAGRPVPGAPRTQAGEGKATWRVTRRWVEAQAGSHFHPEFTATTRLWGSIQQEGWETGCHRVPQRWGPHSPPGPSPKPAVISCVAPRRPGRVSAESPPPLLTFLCDPPRGPESAGPSPACGGRTCRKLFPHVGAGSALCCSAVGLSAEHWR